MKNKEQQSLFRRSISGVLVILIIFVCVIGGGSLAYNVRSEKTHNGISVGEIRVQLVNILPDGVEAEDGNTVFGILPGLTYSNKVFVKNVCKYDEWIRVSVSKEIYDADGTRLDASKAVPTYNSNDWTYKGGYWYYNSILPALGSSKDLITDVYFDTSIGNEYKDATLYMHIIVEAVQSVNNGNSVFEAEGWEVVKA